MHDITSNQKIANKLAGALGKILLEKKLNIATAESCTGGLMSATITEIPGSSMWFKQGWVTYSNNSKVVELNVPKEFIAKHGAVSEQVAIAMARGALDKSGASISIATTGVAGPDGGTPDKPVGTVWIAVAIKNKPIIPMLLTLEGTRTVVRELTVQAVLKKVLELV